MRTDDPLFVFVRIPEALEPLERGEKYEDPLHDELEARGIGEVTGGGTMLSAPDADGNRVPVYCGIDVDLFDSEVGLRVLKEQLVELGAPVGTTLEYKIDGVEYSMEIYSSR